MKTINNNKTFETMNAPQVLSVNELNNIAGGPKYFKIFFKYIIRKMEQYSN